MTTPNRIAAVKRARLLVPTLFFLSGACTLVYQIVWVRMLIVVFGVSVFAVSTVLTAFMAGLALGSLLFGRLADRSVSGLRLYAVLELGIGLFALLFPFILTGLDDVHTLLYRLLEGSPLLFAGARFALVFLVLLIPTTLMGGTLPALCRFAVRHLSSVGWQLGLLYSINTAGAALGCFAAAFFLMEQLGVRGTTFAAAAGNLAIAAVASLMHRVAVAGTKATAGTAGDGGNLVAPGGETEGVDETGAFARTAAGAGAREAGLFPRRAAAIAAAFALSGFAALGYEIVWTRLLQMTLISATVQALSTIVVTFLVGIALGSAAGARYADRLRDGLYAFGLVELLLGVFGLASVAAVASLHKLMAIFPRPVWEAHVAMLFIAAAAVMLLPTLLMGFLFPLVGKMWVRQLGAVGTNVGQVYAINTVGAIFGAFAAGFLLIPLLGTQASVDFLAMINFAVGATLVAGCSAGRVKKLATVVATAALPVLFLKLWIPGHLLETMFEWADRNSRIIHFDEDAAGTVSVHAYSNDYRILKVNGGGEVPTDFSSLQTFRLLGTVPMVVHPDPEEVLVIAFGGGITLATVEAYGPRRIDCVEVVPAVVAAGKHFAEHNDRVYERFGRGRLELIPEDGRNHVLRSDRTYDLIIGDATHPGTADSWVLYTEEFYRLCRARLNPGGMVAQWLPLHGLTVDDFKMILRTFRTVYPHASLWLTRSYAVMLATPERLSIDVQQVEARLREAPIRRALDDVFLGDAVSLLSTFALGEAAMGEYAGQGHTNTDDRPYISFSERKRKGTSRGLPALRSVSSHLAPSILPYLVGADDNTVQQLDRRFEARRHMFLGVVELLQEKWPAARSELRRAIAIDSGEGNAAEILQKISRF